MRVLKNYQNHRRYFKKPVSRAPKRISLRPKSAVKIISESRYIALGYQEDLIKNATPEETALKVILDKAGIRYEFQRIVTINCSLPGIKSKFFILDFHIPLTGRGKLCVELDGSGHLEPGQAERDNIRTWYLKKRKGYKVLRFWNSALDNPELVLKEILRYKPVLLKRRK